MQSLQEETGEGTDDKMEGTCRVVMEIVDSYAYEVRNRLTTDMGKPYRRSQMVAEEEVERQISDK